MKQTVITTNKILCALLLTGFVVACFGLFAGSAQATEESHDDQVLNWNIVEIQYLYPDYKDSYLSGNGFGLAGFTQFKEYGLLYLGGSVIKVSDNYGGWRDEVTGSSLSLGFGGRLPITQATDFFAVAGPTVLHIDFGGGDSGSEGGFFAAGGVRSMFSNRFEAALYVDYTNFDGFDETTVNIDGRYWVNPKFALSFGFSPDSEVNVFSVGFSFAF